MEEVVRREKEREEERQREREKRGKRGIPEETIGKLCIR